MGLERKEGCGGRGRQGGEERGGERKRGRWKERQVGKETEGHQRKMKKNPYLDVCMHILIMYTHT